MRNHIVQIVQHAGRRAQGEHPGLLLNRFLANQNDDGQDKRDLLEAACAAAGSDALVRLYRRAFQRWQTGETGDKAETRLATPPFARLIVGLGCKGVVAAGLCLHHTYGVPLIPGSALKGIAAHYCHDVWGATDARYRREGDFHPLLFGTTEEGGVIRFEDAWMDPDSLKQSVRKDVMTPHHQDWQTKEDTAPTDFDSPIPVPFLSVAGTFHIRIVWQGPKHAQAPAWTARTLDLLTEALREWGVGGKTSSGYGRLVKPIAAKAAPPPPRRPPGTSARVVIVGPRKKGGFDVQEEGYPQGTLTLGTPPAGVNTEPGSAVDVLVHNDDPRQPQYKWPQPAKR